MNTTLVCSNSVVIFCFCCYQNLKYTTFSLSSSSFFLSFLQHSHPLMWEWESTLVQSTRLRICTDVGTYKKYTRDSLVCAARVAMCAVQHSVFCLLLAWHRLWFTYTTDNTKQATLLPLI